MQLPHMIVFVRHGESLRNVVPDHERYIEETPTYVSPLTPRGREQAKKAGEFVFSELGDFDMVFSSTYMRTIETLRIMNGNKLPDHYRETALINERDRGLLSAPPDYRNQLLHPLELFRFRHEDKFHYRGPGGESFADVEQRVNIFLHSLAGFAGKKVLVVGHRSWGVMLWRVLMNKTKEEAMSRHDNKEIDRNTAITVYENVDGIISITRESFVVDLCDNMVATV